MNKIRIVIALILILFSTAPIFGQEDREEYEDAPEAHWHINLDAQGNARTTVSLYGKDVKIDSVAVKAGITEAMRNALQCTPEKVTIHPSKYSFDLSANCRLPVSKQPLTLRASIKPDHVLQEVRKAGAAKMTITLSVPRLGYNRGLPETDKYNSYDEAIRYHIDVKKEQKSLDNINLEFGYSRNAIMWEAALLALILAGPVLLLLWLRKKTLAPTDRDATSVWFGYWRVHRWIVEGIWLAWLITLVSLRIDTFIDFVWGIDNSISYILILLAPPVCVSFFCQYLALPVWLRVRGIDLDRGTMLLKGFWELTAAVAPIAFVILGIISLFHDPRRAMLWFLIALVTKLACVWIYGKVSRSMPRPLHGGELKTRVMELARQAGVRINQVSVMPARLYQMGNAFAMSGGNVMVTDYLLERLTKKETDCVMAHEIGHVKRHHTVFLSWFGFLIIFVLINMGLRIVLSFLPAFFSVSSEVDVYRFMGVNGWIEAYLLYPVSLLFAWLIRYFVSRRCERSADEFATLVTGDPESMITMLAKLSKMNLMPVRWGFWDESLSTHPSILRRSEAIAHRHRITGERLRELLDARPRLENENCYPVPDEAANPAMIFSTEFKTQKTLLISLLLMFSMVAVPLLTGYLIKVAGFHLLTYWAGLILMPIAYLLVANYAAILGYGKLKRKMELKLAQDGIDLAGGQLYFVGIAPEEYPRSYENHTVWDIGFLLVDEKAMAYYGDRMSFAIPRGRITSIAKGCSYPSWFHIPETYIRGANGDKEWVFHLHSLDGRSMTTVARRSKALLLTLIDWHKGKFTAQRAVSAEHTLNLPEFPELSGNHPRRTSTIKGFVMSLACFALLAFGLASLFQLENSMAWYGFGMSAWCLIVANIPLLRYRESKLLPSRRTVMELIQVKCPSCGLTKDVPAERIPAGSVRATCQKCKHQFMFNREERSAVPQTAPLLPAWESVGTTEVALSNGGLRERQPAVQRIFYKISSHRVSIREYCWGFNGNPLTFLIALLAKLLRIRFPSSTDDPNVESLKPFETSEEQLPEDIRSRIQPLMAEMESIGFHSPVFHLILDALNHTKSCLVTYCSPDGSVLGRVHLRIWSLPQPERVLIFPEFLSVLENNTYLWSLASKPDMIAPSSCHVIRQRGASVRELWATHQNALAESLLGGNVRPIIGRDEVRTAIERHHATVRDFHLKRGVFAIMSEEELRESDAMTERLLKREAGGVKEVEVLAEIDRLMQPKRMGSSALWIFVISMVLFLGTVGAQWSWEFILMIMLVLMVHELGHYVAMKIFRYRNLRIFFIPFLGAAVTGRNFNVPVWKKVIVSLMGPLPGIIAGIASGVVGLRMHNSTLLEFGMLSLIINGLNLLPVLPLDGGWVVHNLFFSRHYLFDSAFRLFAALALIAFGLKANDRVFAILGGLLLVTLLPSHRNARIAHDLRKSGFHAVSDDNQSIPDEQAQVIISRVKEAFPTRATKKVIAQYTLNIFETLNSRPPRWLATLGLAGVHAVCFIIAILFAGVFMKLKIGL